MVRPVPPEVVGRAVPERVRFKLALLVGFVTVAFKNAGVVADTEVTVPVPGKSVCLGALANMRAP